MDPPGRVIHSSSARSAMATEDAEASRCVLGIATISRSRPTR